MAPPTVPGIYVAVHSLRVDFLNRAETNTMLYRVSEDGRPWSSLCGIEPLTRPAVFIRIPDDQLAAAVEEVNRQVRVYWEEKIAQWRAEGTLWRNESLIPDDVRKELLGS